ncbi:Elongator complex protein 2 [Schistosoma japonicum]|nr:Elongator complex protein 2 [Schistosoma japonicum]
MDLTFPDKVFYGVEFPAVVNNVDAAIEMLGGLCQISEVFADDKRRLNLSFRPHMVYAKPACGDGRSSNSFIMRVQRFRNKVTGELKLVPVILGRVSRVYKFDAMADFQFGPFERVTTTAEGPKCTPPNYRIFYNDLIIKDPTTMIDSYLSRDVPLYLPPVLFSRQDTPIMYNFAPRYRTTEYIQLEEKGHNLPVSRKARPTFGYLVNLDDITPTSPRPGAVQRVINLGLLAVPVKEAIQKLFDERPIWMRPALAYHMPADTRLVYFDQILPSIAYYMVRGPWSRAWIRYGYDPRKDPESRRYQVTDYHFGPNNWPTTHQVRYCLSDIEIPEVQAMLQEVPDRTEIDPVDGWLPPGGIKRIRDLLGQYLKKWISESNQTYTDSGQDILFSIMEVANKENISLNSKIRCVYTSIGINHFSGCSSTLALSLSDTSTVENILAFGSSHFICLAKSYFYPNDETINLNTNFSKDSFRVYQTLPGHNSDVRCVRWLYCCLQKGSSQVYQQPICFLMSADCCGTVMIWACPTKHLISSNATNDWQIINKFQAPKDCIINAIDGYFFPSSVNDHSCSGILFLSAAVDTSVHNWSVHIPQNLFTCNSVLLPCVSIKNITRMPSLCLCLRSFCVKYSFPNARNMTFDVFWLHIIVLGLDNGQTEIWSSCLASGQNESVESINFTLSVTLSGHQDWTRCVDVCFDQKSVSPVVLIATGGQDSIVRLWRLYSPENDINVTSTGDVKASSFQLPKLFPTNKICVCVAAESVLASHENWVTGVRWASTINCSFPPNLLTCSMDKSLIIWQPPSENVLESSDTCSLWKEKARLGHFGDTGLSLLDCHWLPSDDQKVFVHTFQINLIFSYLELCQEFWFELARPQIHGYNMNAIASISPTFYVSAGDEKVVRVFTTTKDFLNSFKKLFQSEIIRSELDRILADSLIPTGAVQPPLGLSNQITSCTPNNNNCSFSEILNSDEEDNAHNQCFRKEENRNVDKMCASNELPTEDRLQHATLWPEVKKLYGHPYELHCLAVHPHQLLVASACTASKPEYAHIILWNGNSNWCIHQRLQHHQLTVTQLAWSHDGTKLLAVSRDRTWSLWSEQLMDIKVEVMNVQLSNFVLTAYPVKGQSHSRIIWTCAWSPDDRYFFTGSRDSSIYCWNGIVKTENATDNLLSEARRRIDIYKDLGQSVTALDICNSVDPGGISNHHSYLMAVGLESGRIILLKLFETDSSERLFAWSPVFNFPPGWCHVSGKRLRRISFSSEKDNRNNHFRNSIIYLATSGDDGLVRIFKINRELLL